MGYQRRVHGDSLSEIQSDQNPQKNQNAQRRRTYQTHEAQRGPCCHRWQEGSQPCRMHQRIVGLPQEKQLAGSRQQAVLHPRQKDGKGFRYRPHSCFWNGQVLVRTPSIISQNFHYTFRKHADNDAPRKTEKKKLDKNHPWFQKRPLYTLSIKIPLIVNVTIYIQAKFSNLKLSA